MEDRTGPSRRIVHGDLLGWLIYCILCKLGVLHRPLLGSPFLGRELECYLEDLPRLVIGEVFSLSVGSLIMVAPEPVLADTLPYLSNSGISEMSYELFELFVIELKFLDRN